MVWARKEIISFVPDVGMGLLTLSFFPGRASLTAARDAKIQQAMKFNRQHFPHLHGGKNFTS